jgi:DNA (cytosine-5)-methyltransferase 1
MYGLDLFSGIGGITKALEGYVTPVAYCENDRYSQAILLSRMSEGSLPTAPIWDDVSTLRGIFLPPGPIQIIYGGFPCQNVSNQGGKEGLDGEQSKLYFEIIRLVREIRPAFVFLENVSAITVRGLRRITADFAGLRYDCRWETLSAYDIGAPHFRERWFFMAHSHESGRGESAMERQFKGRAKIISPTKTSWPALRGSPKRNGEPPYTGESKLDGHVDGISNWMERRGALGNAVVPAQAREAFERLMGIK